MVAGQQVKIAGQQAVGQMPRRHRAGQRGQLYLQAFAQVAGGHAGWFAVQQALADAFHMRAITVETGAGQLRQLR